MKIIWIDVRRWRCQEGISILTHSTMLAPHKVFSCLILPHACSFILFYIYVTHKHTYTHTLLPEWVRERGKKGFSSKLRFLITISAVWFSQSCGNFTKCHTVSHIMCQSVNRCINMVSGGASQKTVQTLVEKREFM